MNCRIYNYAQGSEEWHALRRGKLTASQAKEVLTPTGKLSKSSEGLIRKLAREFLLDDPLAFEGNRFTEWGNIHEPSARDMFVAETGLEVEQVGFCERHDKPILGCSPDGLIRFGDGEYIAGLEIKCPTVDTHVDYLMDGVLPACYMPQVHFSLAVTGLPVWYFMSYFPALRPLIVKVERDEYTDKIEQAALQFANDYEQKAPVIWEKIRL